MYKNPCYFVNICNKSLCWKVCVRVLGGTCNGTYVEGAYNGTSLIWYQECKHFNYMKNVTRQENRKAVPELKEDKKQNGKYATQTKPVGLRLIQFSNRLEKMEANYAAIYQCRNDE